MPSPEVRNVISKFLHPRKSEDMERLKKEIEQQHERFNKYTNSKRNKEESVKTVSGELQRLYMCIDTLAIPEKDALVLIEKIKTNVINILQQVHSIQEEEKEVPENIIIQVTDDKWLPTPYNSLIRRTPLPQAGSPTLQPAATGSDEEEEVPSRGFLKRQAQLVVDAKSRKKTIRIPRK